MNKNIYEATEQIDSDEKTVEGIDLETVETMSYTDGVKCEYQLLKGKIADRLISNDDLETLIKAVRTLANGYLIYDARSNRIDGGWVIVSQTKEDAVETAEEELKKLLGMIEVITGFAKKVVKVCDLFLRNVFKKHGNASMEDMIGSRDKDGNWDLSVCKSRFADLMLYYMDKYDVKSVPFRATGSLTRDTLEEALFPDVVVNKRALIGVLKDLYDIDSMTMDRLDKDGKYFVEVAKSFLNESKTAMGKTVQRVFFEAYGIETGTPQTLAELAQKYSVTREFIRQLLAKEARKLKHPTRRKKILCLPNTDEE